MRTRSEVEKAAQYLQARGERWRVWMNCGEHNWRALPMTTDTGEHYCGNCSTLWAPDGSVLNLPEPPRPT